MKLRIGQVAQLSMNLGARHLADYGSIKSRHDFTQRQLMSCPILKTYLKTTYRGVIDWLELLDKSFGLVVNSGARAALSARREIYQRQQAALRVLTYALHR